MSMPVVKMPIDAEERALLRLDKQLCFQIYSASRAMTQAYRPLLSSLGLTYPQYLVMLVLWEKQGEAKLTPADLTGGFVSSSVSELGQHLRLDSGTLSPLLKRLEHQGLLNRQRSAKDERQVQVVLTEQGLALSRQAAQVPKTLLCDMEIPREELSSLKLQLEQLLCRLT